MASVPNDRMIFSSKKKAEKCFHELREWDEIEMIEVDYFPMMHYVKKIKNGEFETRKIVRLNEMEVL